MLPERVYSKRTGAMKVPHVIVATLKGHGSCAVCLSPLPKGTVILRTTGFRDERSVCPGCAKLLMGAADDAFKEAAKPEPQFPYFGDDGEEYLWCCPKCKGTHFSRTYRIVRTDRFDIVKEEGEDGEARLEYEDEYNPNPDLGDTMDIVCEDCSTVVWENPWL